MIPILERLARPVLLVACLLVPVLPARGEGELEQAMASGLARTFKEVAAASIPRTACLVMHVGEKRGYGSAAIISRDGYAITCAHVVEVGSKMEAVTSDGRTHAVRRLGTNSVNDYALVKIEGGPFDCFPLGRSADLAVGDWVMALGHPGGPYVDRKPAFAAGRVTGLHKRLPVQLNKKFYDDAIKTNVPIFAGNSGGPLVDMEGRLVGINGAILLVNENAYAVPIDEIAPDIPALKAGRDVAGRSVKDFRKLLQELQSEIDPKDMDKMFGKSPMGKMFGMLFKRFGGGGDAPRKPRPPTRTEFLGDYFLPLNRMASNTVVEILSRGKRAGFGVIVRPNGTILTNYRVATKPKLTVRVPGRATVGCEVRGLHGILDVAVLRVRLGGDPLPAAPLRSARSLRPGDWVITPGPGRRPLAVGVVSAMGRSVGTSRKMPTMGLFGMFGTPNESPLRPYETVFMHDSRLVKGTFGSPLFDVRGRLVGLNVANFYPGSSFAVPIDAVAPVLKKLEAGLRVAPPATYGAQVQKSPFGGGKDMFQDLLKKFQDLFSSGELDLEKLFSGELDLEKLLEKLFGQGVPKPGQPQKGRPFLGVQVDTSRTDKVVLSGVVAGSAAAKAGLREGDVVLALGGIRVRDFETLRRAIAPVKVGQTVKVRIERAGKTMTLSVVMGSR